ncbi:MAG: hypothetical protein ACFFD4_06775 [Candidatus Odinarchaeota archaeon]
MSSQFTSVYDALITEKSGRCLFYQKFHTESVDDDPDNVERTMMSGLYQALEVLASSLSDSFDEIQLKGMRIFFLSGSLVNCYVRVSRESKLNKLEIESIFQNVIRRFESKYYKLLVAGEGELELFDTFSDVISQDITREILKNGVKSSEILKNYLGIEIKKKDARKILKNL